MNPGVNTPVEVGGMGGTFIDEMILTEEMAYHFCSSPAVALHSNIVMPYISEYGTREQQEKYIPRMMSGECIASIAMTEPDAGSDLQGIRTTARRDGDDWIINGSKIYITNGWLTDCCVVVAKTGDYDITIIIMIMTYTLTQELIKELHMEFPCFWWMQIPKGFTKEES